jgi:tRNA (guanine-N7-)-methyltransferase
VTPTDPNETAPPYHRRVRSFVTRAGRVSNAQQRALDTLLPRFGVPFSGQTLDLTTLFGRNAPTVLEIGFGMGETTALMAHQHPAVNFLGIEVHTPGVGSLLKRIAELEIGNLRIVQHDAVEVLQTMIAPESLAGLHIFFPDPWPKARHHKRRLIQPALVELASSRLAPGAYLHCATDWQPYAEQMLEVLAACPLLTNGAQGYATRVNPLLTRAVTKFETRGVKLGHAVYDLVFVRRS